MKTSNFVTSVFIDDPRVDGRKVELHIHDVDGNLIGIESDFSDEVANYILNPYEDCQLIKLGDPVGNDAEIDPPLDEDDLVGMLKVVKAVDDIVNRYEPEIREKFASGLGKLSGLAPDRINFLFGLASKTLEELK